MSRINKSCHVLMSQVTQNLARARLDLNTAGRARLVDTSKEEEEAARLEIEKEAEGRRRILAAAEATIQKELHREAYLKDNAFELNRCLLCLVSCVLCSVLCGVWGVCDVCVVCCVLRVLCGVS